MHMRTSYKPKERKSQPHHQASVYEQARQEEHQQQQPAEELQKFTSRRHQFTSSCFVMFPLLLQH
jgi:hypothetical protein